MSVLGALLLTMIGWLLLTYPILTSGIVYSRAMMFFLMLALVTLTVWRITFARVVHLPRFRRRAIIVGQTQAGETIARELRQAKYPFADVLGYIDTTPNNGVPPSHELPLLGNTNTLRSMIHRYNIDLLIMAIDYGANVTLFQQAIEATQLGVTVTPMTTIYERMSGKIAVEYVGDQWYAALPVEVVLSPLYLCWRVVLDIMFGLVGTFILFLILPIVATLIYLDSPGPIFYKQERLGCNGRTFFMYKFRSMHVNAERLDKQYGRLIMMRA